MNSLNLTLLGNWKDTKFDQRVEFTFSESEDQISPERLCFTYFDKNGQIESVNNVHIFLVAGQYNIQNFTKYGITGNMCFLHVEEKESGIMRLYENNPVHGTYTSITTFEKL
jgi:hypothetical protein